MNINVQKIERVIIKDSDGRTVMSFELGMIAVATLADKSQVLEIKKARDKKS